MKDRLGPYTLLDRIGRGGMGEVYIARRDEATDVCVLKQLRGEHTKGDLVHRLKREANVLSQLDHPNIARLTDAGVVDGTFYFTLEFIGGQTLRGILRRLLKLELKMPPEIAVRIAEKVLSGLAYAHQQIDPEGNPLDLVHRDLSPNNIMLAYDGRVKIIDFGIASGKVDEYRTTPGVILGTMRYISPEQALSKPVDRRTDLYTLGVVLYEMLTGAPVVPRGGNHTEILNRVLREKAAPFSEVAAELPAALWPVVARAIAKPPAKRWPDAPAFREALLEAAAGSSLPSEKELAAFMATHFPGELQRDAARMIAEDEDTFSEPGQREPVDNTDSSTENPMHAKTVAEVAVATRTGPSPLDLPPAMPTVAEVRDTSVSPMPAPLSGSLESAPPRKRPRLALLAAIATAATMVLLVSALDRTPAPAPPPPAVAPPPKAPLPQVTVRPLLEAKPVQPKPPPIEAPEPAPVSKKRRPARKIAPPKPPPPPVQKAPPTLDKKLEALRLTPDNMPLMLDLKRDIERAAQALPAGPRARIDAELKAAIRSGNVEGIARAMQILKKSASQ